MNHKPTFNSPNKWTPAGQQNQAKAHVDQGRSSAGQPQSPRRRRRKINPTLIAFTAFILILLVGGGILATYYYLNVHKQLASFVRPVSRSQNEPQDSANNGSYDSISGRSWNILLLGSDNDGKYSYPALLTQVMMIVHVDAVTNKVSMVSIPRDSWVYVPNMGMHKIDQAFFLGATSDNTFESGVRLARLTVEQDYGVTIDRYAWVGLGGFAKVIDTLGGVDLDVTHPVVDDTYPDDTGQSANPNDPFAYKRLYLAPGPQHLNGLQTLEYVRSRHADLVGDIGRTQRQQQVLEALKKKLNASNIINNLPALLQDLSGQVYTDITEDEMLAFANWGRTLNSGSIQRLTLGPGQGDQDFGEYANVYDPSVNAQQAVIVPNCTNIQPALSRLLDIYAGCNVAGP
ncbi:LytR family transcriptional regulator [Ktedonosporobacter rubrisoli]|uniref:LytR family transcriptional regulator n=1 Tax=Ktedonosporobacter rubrisoli TaxID=2509675 RepID=A0A4P6K1R0_KTERU|nr:LCP family protein [Ktedonosporobacter rubrisoli]QBD81406.1 LytR family transcriptional regulator [Ktedonosporobacter rubrisoli]